MSIIRYANRLRCDWPGCRMEGDVTLASQGEHSYREILPPGWESLRAKGYVAMRDMRGLDMSDFCPVHSQCSIHTLLDSLAINEVYHHA
jgi:hypothetical protein